MPIFNIIDSLIVNLANIMILDTTEDLLQSNDFMTLYHNSPTFCYNAFNQTIN